MSALSLFTLHIKEQLSAGVLPGRGVIDCLNARHACARARVRMRLLPQLPPSGSVGSARVGGGGTETLQVFGFYEQINGQLHYQRLIEHQQIHHVTNGPLRVPGRRREAWTSWDGVQRLTVGLISGLKQGVVSFQEDLINDL